MIRTICSRIRFRHVIVTQVGGYRKVPVEELAEIFREDGVPEVEAIEDVPAAFERAVKEKGEDGMLFCVGSLYLVGEIKAVIRRKKIMIDYEEELKKFEPCLDVADVEGVIYDREITDIMDVLQEMLREVKSNRRVR